MNAKVAKLTVLCLFTINYSGARGYCRPPRKHHLIFTYTTIDAARARAHSTKKPTRADSEPAF